MPLYEYQCKDCGHINGILVIGKLNNPVCNSCGSKNMTKKMSAHSSSSGIRANRVSNAKDISCCGISPDQTDGCADPGTCCGRLE